MVASAVRAVGCRARVVPVWSRRVSSPALPPTRWTGLPRRSSDPPSRGTLIRDVPLPMIRIAWIPVLSDAVSATVAGPILAAVGAGLSGIHRTEPPPPARCVSARSVVDGLLGRPVPRRRRRMESHSRRLRTATPHQNGDVETTGPHRPLRESRFSGRCSSLLSSPQVCPLRRPHGLPSRASGAAANTGRSTLSTRSGERGRHAGSHRSFAASIRH
jgi:hypothetical protein